jgi:23S rRNA (guanosine2251-2'-O)-methyltransferase
MRFDSANSSNEFIVEGMSALAEYIRHKPNSIKRVCVSPKYKDKIHALIGSRDIKVSLIDERNARNEKGHSVSPVYAVVEIHYQSFSNLLNLLQKSQEHKLILALDHITDPRNLGAIARSAAFFGVKHILIPKMRQVLLTEASVATSQGAFAFSELVLVSNLNQSLEKLKEEGFWVICADAGGEPFEKVVREYQKVVLVLGSEGSGVSDLVKKRSDRIVSIASQHQILDSLNVSVAAGILLNGFAIPQVPRSNS